MTSDELQAWNEAIAESFEQGEVYTVQSTPSGSARAVAVSELASQFITGTDLDGQTVVIDRETGVGAFDGVSLYSASPSDPWDFNIANPGDSSIYTTPMFGYGVRYGIGASPSQSTYFKFSQAATMSGSYGGQGSSASKVSGDLVLNVFWQDVSSYDTWKGLVGFGSYEVTYPLQSLGQQIALDSYVNLYQSWWYYTSASSDNIVERMRIKPGNNRIALKVNSGVYSDGATIWTNDDGSKYVFHCDAWDDTLGWHVYITDGAGNLVAMELPYVITSLGFTADIGSEDTAAKYDGVQMYNQAAMVQLAPASYGWAVATVFYWKSGDGFVFGDVSSGTDLNEVINAQILWMRSISRAARSWTLSVVFPEKLLPALLHRRVMSRVVFRIFKTNLVLPMVIRRVCLIWLKIFILL